jgi:hypothetical protein
MATALKTKPGINGANVLSIPTDWDPTWFRHFINNSLKGADVRNAIGANGITISGTIASPYATISGGGSTTFTAPIVINSVAGQVSLTVNGAANSLSELIQGSLTAGQSFGLVIQAGTNASDDPFVVKSADATKQFFRIHGDGSGFLGPNATNNLSWNTAGDFIIAAPSSGIALTLGAFAGERALDINPASGSAYASFSLASTVKGYIGTSGGAGQLIGTSVQGDLCYRAQFFSHLFSVDAGGSASVTIASTGAVIIAAPSSGAALNANALTGSPGLQSSTNDSTFSATGHSSIILANASITGQTPLDFFIGGSLSGRLRNDYAGNMTYVTTGSGQHTFFVRGDSGVGAAALYIGSGGGVTIFAPTAGTALSLNSFAGTQGLDINQTVGAGGYMTFSTSSVVNALIGINIISGGGASDLGIRTVNHALRFSIDNGSSSCFLINTTGAVTIAAPSSGAALSVTGANSAYVAQFTAGGGPGTSFGAQVLGGTNASDVSFRCLTQSAGALLFQVAGDGGISFPGVATTTTAPGAGGAGALPATPKGYFTITIGASAQKVAYY